ncbi:hypothetical protein BH23VER1_BH23VER1_06190 [soil metagenome]
MSSIDFTKLDKTLHEKGRLSIMTLLASRQTWSFHDLKSELAMSDGNLISHLRSLESAGHLAATKHPEKRKTTYRLTPSGRNAFSHYLGVLEQIIAAANHNKTNNTNTTSP